MQREPTPGPIVRGQAPPRNPIVPPLRLDICVPAQNQAVGQEELHAVVRVRDAGVDGEVHVPEIGVGGVFFRQGLVAECGKLFA